MKKKENRIRIQLLTYPDCPDAEATRQMLRKALAELGMQLEIEEVDLSATDTPETLAAWGSPTVLVNGKDIADEGPTGPGCRLYEDGAGGATGVPPDRLIRAALGSAGATRRDWLRSVASIPGAISSVLPVAT